MTVAIIDYGSGNLRSVAKAFEYVGGGAKISVTAEAAALDDATHIVLPGVGAFADCMRGLSALPGMVDALERNVRKQKKPFLGICVGMQMLFEQGHEHGVHKGLGWVGGEVVKLRVEGRGSSNDSSPLAPRPSPLKIPHMGWNELHIARPHTLLAGINNGDHAYFVHSYHAVCADPAAVLATTDYGGPIVAAVAHENIMGTQFHPEKSQEVGLKLLGNFLKMGG